MMASSSSGAPAANVDSEGSDPELEPDYETISAEEASQVLVEMLAQLKQSGVLSAKQTCVLAFWAAKAGAGDHVKKLGFRPNAPTCHFPDTLTV